MLKFLRISEETPTVILWLDDCQYIRNKIETSQNTMCE